MIPIIFQVVCILLSASINPTAYDFEYSCNQDAPVAGSATDGRSVTEDDKDLYKYGN